jgi:serine/threonine-protein kinase
MSTSSPGSLEGKYEVLAKLREGGMGAIYKVRHRLLGELRVIKVMRPEVAQSAEQRKRFLREAQTATRLRHANIVAFYDFFVDEEDTAYMVMEYIEGINLRDMLQGFGAFPVSLGIDLSRQCLSAFEYLHRRKIVHRDVSPDNIMMTREEDGTLRAKLIDLGIAKIAQATEELTAADEFIGKLRYSSPEQLMKSASSPQIDGRSDLFSLGIVTYEILTGICPYGGESIHEIVGNRIQRPPLSFEESDPTGRLSPAVRETILKALRIAPEERFQSASEFEKALEKVSRDAAGENREQFEQYVNKCMIQATEAARGRDDGASDLGPTMKAKLGGPEARAQITNERDLKFRNTIAEWSATTPASDAPSPREVPPGESQKETFDQSAPDATVTAQAVARAAPRESRPSQETRRRLPFGGYVGVALSAALLVGFGVWISGRDRGTQRTELQRPIARANLPGSSREETAPTPARDVNREPTPAPRTTPSTASVAVPVFAEGRSAVEKQPTPAPIKMEATASSSLRAAQAKSTPRVPTRPRPTPATRLAQLLPTKPARRTNEAETGVEAQQANPRRDATALGTEPKMRYCAQFDKTAYEQGVVKDVPTGFDGMAAKAPRPDSGLMKVNVSISKERPTDDESFFVVVRFENGGDARVDVQRLEESSSRGGMRPVGGAAVPVSVSPGGVKELYRYPLTLSGGEPYDKRFVVTDSKGDSWKSGIRMVPCGD